MVAPVIRDLPPAPRPTDEESVFDSKAFNWVDVLNAWTGDVNELVAWLNLNIGRYAIKTIPDATYSVVNEDSGAYIRLTNPGAKTITVEAQSTTEFQNSTYWNVRNANTGNAALSPANGVTITPPNGGTLVIPPNGTVTLVRVSENHFDLMGQVVVAA